MTRGPPHRLRPHQTLDALLADGAIHAWVAEKAKEKYRALRAAVRDSAARAERLTRRLDAETRRVPANAADPNVSETQTYRPLTREEEAEIDALVDEAREAENEADLAEAREQKHNAEVYELSRRRDERRRQIQAVDDEHAAALAPHVSRARGETNALRDQLKRDAARKEELVRARDETAAALAAVEAETRAELAERDAASEALAAMENAPEKTRKGNQALETAVESLRARAAKLDARVEAEESAAAAQAATTRRAAEEHAATAATLERARVDAEARERAADEIQCELEREGLEGDQHLADRARLALDARAAEEERSAATETLAREKKAKDAALRRLRKAQLAAERAAEQLPELKDRREALELDARDLARERDATAAAIAETRDEIHATTSEYLREESKGKERGVMFEHLHAEVMELEAEIVALKSEERARARAIAELKTNAARSERAAAAKTAKYKEQAAEVRQRDALAHDLKKRRRDITNNIKEFDKLYEMVKEQRNAFVTLITSSRRSVAELREKLKILANEIDVLRGESADKETTLFRTHQDHAKARSERDSARAEMNKARVVFRERREELDEQISIIDSLGDVVDTAEKEMLRMRRRYEDAVERRNQTGVALIDRNDELCILYEKANLQEEVSRRGEIELRKREDEIRALTIEVADAERSIEVARRTMTRVPGLDEQVASLQAQLLLERREVERLSAELEAPENKSRWRKLEGQVPDAEELAAKLESLQARLDDKEEQLAEKNLVLDEVTRLAGRLRTQAAESRADTLELASRVNDYRARIRAATKSLMATVSELSMYQASAASLEEERDWLVDDLAMARERAASGEAPDEDAEREWARQVRSEETASAAARDREDAAAARADGSTISRAAQRPNAYVPSDPMSMGVPRPYGAHAPFKPTAPGANMRHYRAPEPREIVIT